MRRATLPRTHPDAIQHRSNKVNLGTAQGLTTRERRGEVQQIVAQGGRDATRAPRYSFAAFWARRSSRR